MPYEMKSLNHQGIYVPVYDYKGFSIAIQGRTTKLGPRSEQMAVAWVKKAQSATSPPDKVYYKNFIREFVEVLKSENPAIISFLQDFYVKHAESIDKDDFKWLNEGKLQDGREIDFSEIADHLSKEQLKKLSMAKEEKKKLAQERKNKREALKEKYGYAFVDRKKIEIANWTAEPSCLFAGRGNHPKRGKWKEGPREEDIILNLAPDVPRPAGNWRDIIWEPTRMYIAKWEDKLSGKIKYVWFSDSAFLKQEREKEKFQKAEGLGRKIPEIEAHIMKHLDSKDDEKRKTATVCWLILKLNMRVGDEKDPGEADTVGAITLRPEHIKIEGNALNFDFLGKDAVRWVKKVEAPPIVIRNIKEYLRGCKEYLFEDIDSKKVSKFLSEKMEGLTAKVFRTWKCTQTVNERLHTCKAKREDPEYEKLFCAKMANLEAAKIANHKRKVPDKFEERLAKKEAKLKDIEATLKEKAAQGKKTDAITKRLEKAKLDIELTKETKEYNLGTSLKSYIDPKTYVRWAQKIDFCLDKLYSKALRNKYGWALGKTAECSKS